MTASEFAAIGRAIDHAGALGLIDAKSEAALHDALSSAYSKSCAFDLLPQAKRLSLLEDSVRARRVA